MIRVAAVGDVHFASDLKGRFRQAWSRLDECADVLLLCGDLTNMGEDEQADGLAEELAAVPIPMVAVLGNHDYEADRPARVRSALESAGVTVLEGERIMLEIDGRRVGIAGTKGFGGGFAGACGHDFGEPEMKAFMRLTEGCARGLQDNLRGMDADYRIALLHYAPIKDTLMGERLEIYPFLGSYLLAEALDHAGADLVVHGHAHRGTEKGVTAKGIPVRNVAMPLIRRPFAIYTLGRAESRPLTDGKLRAA